VKGATWKRGWFQKIPGEETIFTSLQGYSTEISISGPTGLTAKREGREKTRMSRTGLSEESDFQGFTFLELLAVMVILTTFASLLSVRIHDKFSRGARRLESRIVIGEVTRFRGRAAYTHQEQIMGLELDGKDIYSLAVPSRNGDAEPGPGALLPKGVFFQEVVTPFHDNIRDGRAMVRFFADGCVEHSLIYLRNTKEEFYTLEINPLTGHVDVYEGYVDKEIQN